MLASSERVRPEGNKDQVGIRDCSIQKTAMQPFARPDFLRSSRIPATVLVEVLLESATQARVVAEDILREELPFGVIRLVAEKPYSRSQLVAVRDTVCDELALPMPRAIHNLYCLAATHVFQFVLELQWRPVAKRIKDSQQGLKQVGFAGTVLTDQNGIGRILVEGDLEISEVLELLDPETLQSHEATPLRVLVFGLQR
jgi:hypothetical protein